jgi:hypothetical protein
MALTKFAPSGIVQGQTFKLRLDFHKMVGLTVDLPTSKVRGQSPFKAGDGPECPSCSKGVGG